MGVGQAGNPGTGLPALSQIQAPGSASSCARARGYRTPVPFMPQCCYVPPPPKKKHWEWPGAVLASGLRFRLTWVSVTFQLGDLGLIPNLLASVSSPVKWAKYSICQNKDEMRTCGTSVNGGMFVFNKYLLRVYYGPGTELIALHITISFNSSTLLLTTFYKGGN